MADNQEHEWKYRDPEENDPSRKGMLLSNEIEKFCKVGLLIEEWDPSCLRPAAYTLKIGDDYTDSDGNRGHLTDTQDSFVMRPNSIVFVSTKEKLNLPFYIAARFNIRVKWVYKGILLGTGPQVEPGFKGYLSCPLYNLTDRPMRIRRGDKFATIDFERTTDFCRGKPWKEIEPDIKQDRDIDKVKVDEENFLLFPQESFKPLQHLENEIVSSLTQLEREVKTWRSIGIGLLISFFALAVAIVGFGVNIYREVSGNTKDVVESKTKIDNISAIVSKHEEAIKTIEQRSTSKAGGAPQKGK